MRTPRSAEFDGDRCSRVLGSACIHPLIPFRPVPFHPISVALRLLRSDRRQAAAGRLSSDRRQPELGDVAHHGAGHCTVRCRHSDQELPPDAAARGAGAGRRRRAHQQATGRLRSRAHQAGGKPRASLQHRVRTSEERRPTGGERRVRCGAGSRVDSLGRESTRVAVVSGSVSHRSSNFIFLVLLRCPALLPRSTTALRSA